MEKLPKEWIERIFKRLESIYGERWQSWYGNQREIRKNFLFTQWENGLYGLTGAQIRHALKQCEKSYFTDPPTVMEFHHYARGFTYPNTKPPRIQTDKQKQLAYKNLSQIKSILI